MLLQLKKCPCPNNQWHDMNVIDLLKQARNTKVAADYPPMAYPPMTAPKYKPMPPVQRYAPMEPTVSKPITSKPTVSRKVVAPVPEPVVPAIKPKATNKTPSKRGLYDYSFNELYNAIVHAETGSERNPWIRTKYAPAGGSTAYGEAQLTGGTVRDLIARYPNAFKPLKGYTDKFLKQADLFATFGREPHKPGYRKEYDYGGVGLGVPIRRVVKYPPKSDGLSLEAISDSADTKTKIKEITFPAEEIDTLKKQNRIVTTRVSADYNKLFVDDLVQTPWGDIFKVTKREEISDVKDHPYFNELTEGQKKFLSKYDKIAVLTLMNTKVQDALSFSTEAQVENDDRGPISESDKKKIGKYIYHGTHRDLDIKNLTLSMESPDKKEQLMYRRLAQISLWAKIQDLKKNNAKTWDSLPPNKKLELIIQAWRGKPLKEDPQYYRKVINKLKSYINPSI